MTPSFADGFSGLAGAYRVARPDYPREMVEAIVGFAGRVLAVPGALYVDVGAGTGISTAAVLRGLPCAVAAIGIEPDGDMRSEAQAASAAGEFDGRPVSFVDGSAERLPIPTARAALLSAGQAVHWFDRQAFYREAIRVLIPGGTLALFENNRDWRSSAFLDAHETFLEAYATDRSGRPYRRTDREQPYAQEVFLALGNVTARSFGWTRKMTAAAFLTMARSSTRARHAFRALGEERALAEMGAYAGRHADAEGNLAVPYRTHLYLARRA